MSKEHISILTASAQTHYIAIVIFAILFGLFYVFNYTDQFKDIRTKLGNWTTTHKTTTNDSEKAIDDESDTESENESIDDDSMRDVLSPF
jgi:hypothetical protein